MFFWNSKHQLSTKSDFYSKISTYYRELSSDQIPTELLNAIIAKVTHRIHNNYKHSWKKYPKSKERYSTLKIEDVEHPFIHYLISDFLESSKVSNTENYAKILLKMNDQEYVEYLERKRFYENM